MDGSQETIRLVEDLKDIITDYTQYCYKSEKFCDLTLRGQDGQQSVSCHRCVLAAVFPHFKLILDSQDDMVDIILPDFSFSHILDLIDRVYSHLNEKYFELTEIQDSLASTLNGYYHFQPVFCSQIKEDLDAEALKSDEEFGFSTKFEEEDEHNAEGDNEELSSLFQKIVDQDQEGKKAQKKKPRLSKRTKKDEIVRTKGKRGRKKGSGLKSEVKRFKTVTHLDYSNFENLEELKNSLKCDCPGISFNNLKEQQNHFYSVHCQNEFTICDTCGNPVRTYNIQAHRESCASEVGPFLCPECGKEFPRRCNLNSHVFSYHKRVKCKSCGEEFVGNLFKRIHERTKHVKSFNCDHCPLQFNTMLKKKSHMVSVHLPDHLRPHVCLDCGQGFLYEDKLKRHRMNKHIRSRPFACRCGCVDVAYNDQSTRNQHENRNHPDHPIVVDRLTNKIPRSKPKVRTTS